MLLQRLPRSIVVNLAVVVRTSFSGRIPLTTTVAGVEWHFFPDSNGVVGPSQSLLDLLRSNNIPYVVHLP